MGTLITLSLGGLDLDSAKNMMGWDHGFLFCEGDRTRCHSDQVDYDYIAEHPDEEYLSAAEAAFCRPLSKVLPRLDLAGRTIGLAREEYDAAVARFTDKLSSSRDDERSPNPMTFEEFCEFACRQPISCLDATYVEFTPGESTRRLLGRFIHDIEAISRIPNDNYGSEFHMSELTCFESKVCILSPYSMLQVLGLCEANRDLLVVWQYGPIVANGYLDLANFVAGARRWETFLVATEGSTDARILRHALALLAPDIADFFRFVDVDSSYPFAGAGNLVKFAEGLVRIDVQNQVLFVLDNDAEGQSGLRKLLDLGMPRNMRAMVLPDLLCLREFPCQGPEGLHVSDINGRAAAIECYLDLNIPGRPAAHVQWTNYKKEVQVWQGALEHKESYMRRFLDQTQATLKQGYDTSKLRAVLETLIAEAGQLAGSVERPKGTW